MKEYQLGVVESEFADLIWEREPISSAELVKRSEEQFHWNRSTTYTVLRRLAAKGIFRLEDGIVTALVKREQFYATQSQQYVEENFNGSLPAFLSAFASAKRLSPKEVESIRQMIADYEEGK